MLAAAGLENFEFRVFRAQTCVSMVCSEREGPEAPHPLFQHASSGGTQCAQDTLT